MYRSFRAAWQTVRRPFISPLPSIHSVRWVFPNTVGSTIFYRMTFGPPTFDTRSVLFHSHSHLARRSYLRFQGLNNDNDNPRARCLIEKCCQRKFQGTDNLSCGAPPLRGGGGISLHQAYRRSELIPSSSPTTPAGLSLENQFWTASRLRVMSYCRRVSGWFAFKVFILLQWARILSVISGQPQTSKKRGTKGKQPNEGWDHA